jgi:hypothetical protein
VEFEDVYVRQEVQLSNLRSPRAPGDARNAKRFPADFMFQLTKPEAEALRSQIVISNIGRGGRRYEPYVFTEQGVAMLSGVLRSDRAIAVNIEIMRAFVELRRVAGSLQETVPEAARPASGTDASGGSALGRRSAGSRTLRDGPEMPYPRCSRPMRPSS